jgi:hypothetical protein
MQASLTEVSEPGCTCLIIELEAETYSVLLQEMERAAATTMGTRRQAAAMGMAMATTMPKSQSSTTLLS